MLTRAGLIGVKVTYDRSCEAHSRARNTDGYENQILELSLFVPTTECTTPTPKAGLFLFAPLPCEILS